MIYNLLLIKLNDGIPVASLSNRNKKRLINKFTKMKKIILFAILLGGGITFAGAQSTSEPQTVTTEQVVVTDGYKEVALKDLGEAVQTAVKNLAGDTFDVKKIELNEEKGLTRVTLTNKADATEKVAILDKDGKEVTPDKN